jgi:hypothetical protein
MIRFKFKIFSLAQQWFGIENQGICFTEGSEIVLNKSNKHKEMKLR